jgi:hypothetical protein
VLLVPFGITALPYIGACVLVGGATVALIARRRERALWAN